MYYYIYLSRRLRRFGGAIEKLSNPIEDCVVNSIEDDHYLPALYVSGNACFLHSDLTSLCQMPPT